MKKTGVIQIAAGIFLLLLSLVLFLLWGWGGNSFGTGFTFLANLLTLIAAGGILLYTGLQFRRSSKDSTVISPKELPKPDSTHKFTCIIAAFTLLPILCMAFWVAVNINSYIRISWAPLLTSLAILSLNLLNGNALLNENRYAAAMTLSNKRCPKCSKEYERDFNYCPYCAVKLQKMAIPNVPEVHFFVLGYIEFSVGIVLILFSVLDFIGLVGGGLRGLLLLGYVLSFAIELCGGFIFLTHGILQRKILKPKATT